jgi:hypothetical protein
MKRTLFAIMVVAVAGALAAGSAAPADEKIQSTWQSAPLTVDGVAQEWDSSEPIIDEGSNVQYALRNDGRNLYIIMVFRSPERGARTRIFPKSTLDYTGMKIYFTAGTKKSKDYGILFQKKEYTAEALIANREKRGQALSEAEKAEIRKKPTHIVYTEEVIKPKKDAAAGSGAVESDQPMYRQIDKGPLTVCEFRIPLNRVNALGGIDAKPGQEIMLGFEWGGMTQQILRDMMAGRSDSSVSARDSGSAMQAGLADSMAGGDAGGEIRGMGGGVGEMGRNPRYQKHAFWISAKLAAEK